MYIHMGYAGLRGCTMSYHHVHLSGVHHSCTDTWVWTAVHTSLAGETLVYWVVFVYPTVWLLSMQSWHHFATPQNRVFFVPNERLQNTPYTVLYVLKWWTGIHPYTPRFRAYTRSPWSDPPPIHPLSGVTPYTPIYIVPYIGVCIWYPMYTPIYTSIYPYIL